MGSHARSCGWGGPEIGVPLAYTGSTRLLCGRSISENHRVSTGYSVHLRLGVAGGVADSLTANPHWPQLSIPWYVYRKLPWYMP